jgi:hypothetical protein
MQSGGGGQLAAWHDEGLGRREMMLAPANAISDSKRVPFLDTYRTMCLAPDTSFQRVLEEIGRLSFAA